ncbi:Ff.00g035630.m01.CDS01 [Fusarium sp. VM40]|nr:Ff.00g035630.m01.CDS01 [Fusarium sp. VM40]
MATNSNIPAGQASNMTPNYEVKLLLKPNEVHSSENGLTSNVLAAFDIRLGVIKQTIQYLDTNDKDLYAAGWGARIRKTENEDGVELTYKKRYAMEDHDIDAALTKANNDGFNGSEGKYDAQVEWGYQKKTLSISRKRSADFIASGMELPDESRSRSMLIKEAPTKFDNFVHKKWGTGLLATSRLFGPVHAKRYVGKWEGTRIYLEVWTLRNAQGTGYENLVEASLKTETHMDAFQKQASLISYLQGEGWFLEQDSLRTRLIMERY